MSACNPAKDVAAFLVTNTATTGCTVSNTFYPLELAPDDIIPKAAVFCVPMPSPPPRNHLGTGTAEWSFSVLVIVRGNPQTVEATRSLAATIGDLLNRAVVTDSVHSGSYVSCVASQAAPAFRGFTDTELPRWAVAVQLLQLY